MKKLSRLLIFVSIICFTSSTMSQHYALTDKMESDKPATINNPESVISNDSINIPTEADSRSQEETNEIPTDSQQSFSDKNDEDVIPATILNDSSDHSITAYAGSGTEIDPYLVGSQAEMISALAMIQNDSGTGTYYIELTGNIIYDGATVVFNIHKDVIIDGKGYYVLHNNDSPSRAERLFNVAVAGLTVTLRNMNFGSDTLMDGNNMLYNKNPSRLIYRESVSPSSIYDVSVIIENINYYGTVYFDVISAARVTFKGHNSFRNSGRFVINHQVFFAENSTTVIEGMQPSSSSIDYCFYLSNASLNEPFVIDRNAELSIVTPTPKAISAINSIRMDIREEARLFIHTTHPTAISSYMIYHTQYANAVGTMIQVGPNATVVHESQTMIGNSYTFMANKPKYIAFRAASRQTLAGRGIFTVNRLDTASAFGGHYQVSYRYANTQLGTLSVFPNTAVSRDLTNVYSGSSGTYDIIYQPNFVIDEIQVEPEVGIDLSNLTTTINTTRPPERPLTKYDFKLSKQRLWTGSSINTQAAQTQINNATLATNGMVAVRTSPTESFWQEQKLYAGTYYVYVKVTGQLQEDPELAHLPSESFWYEVVVEMPKSPLNVEVPLEKIFKIREEGPFDTSESSQPIISHSNFPINLTVNEVVEHTTDSPVTLVNEILPGANKQLRLHLGTTNNQDSGPLVVGLNQASPIEILPFLDNPLHLYLKGEYAGGLQQKHEVSYSFVYQLTAK